jgi:hypothetical protein
MKHLKTTLKILALLAYAVVFLELFVRIFAPQAILPRYITKSDYGIRVNIPNANYWHFTPEVTVAMHTNSAGMRDHREYPLDKTPGTCRAILLGDSFFMGYEAIYEDSFAFQLETSLKNQGAPCEILNFSVSGFGTAESLIQLQEVGIKYQPDFVVLEWHHTDPDDNRRSNLFRVRNDELTRYSAEFLPGVATQDKLMTFGLYRWVSQYSHLYSAIRESIATSVKKFIVDLQKLRKTEDKTAIATQEKKTPSQNVRTLDGLLVDEVAKLANSVGANLILADVPDQIANGDIRSSFRLLPQDITSPIEKASPTKQLETLRDEGVLVFRQRGQKHLTPIGYKALADAVAEPIIRSLSEQKSQEDIQAVQRTEHPAAEVEAQNIIREK